MQQLTPAAHQAVQTLAQRYAVSTDAVLTLLSAVVAGNGTMAQFYHPELGGGGQWMQGGMTMVGDMFNGRLQSTVSGLCGELSQLLNAGPVYLLAAPEDGARVRTPGNVWWPAELGQPSSSGGQNDSKYAYFPAARRLAVSQGGQVTLYDTLDHQIGGVQQQQGGSSGTQAFTSQFGTFTVESLPRVGPHAAGASAGAAESAERAAPPRPPSTYGSGSYGSAPQSNVGSAPQSNVGSAPQSDSPIHAGSTEDVLSSIERLAQLHQRGILSDAEFSAKKAELLSRL
jgi:hypothetical protein